MAKLYKVRKKCMICSNVFYPRYAGSLYCEECKNRKGIEEKKKLTKEKRKKIKPAKKVKAASRKKSKSKRRR